MQSWTKGSAFWEAHAHELPLHCSSSHGCSKKGEVLPSTRRGSHMASILPFVRNKSDFDDEATRLMGEAFGAVCSVQGPS